MTSKLIKMYKNLLFVQKKNPIEIFSLLKYRENFSDMKKVINNFSKFNMYNSYLFGNPLPNSYATLGKSPKMKYVESITQQINWLVINFQEFSEQINNFLKLKQDYEKYLLIGQYNKAKDIIEKVNEDICYSLWSIENILIIAEYQEGLEKNKKVLSDINAENKIYTIALFSDFFSRRTEKNISFQKYIETIDKFIEKNSNINPKWIEYFNFKLNFFNYDTYSYFSEILHSDANFSILDRYLTFINICQLILGNNSFANIHKEISESIETLNKSIKDPQLERLVGYLKPNEIINSILGDKKNGFYEVLDEYTIGNYEKSLELSENLILKYPSSFEFYEIYLKSFINLNYNYNQLIKLESECICTDMINHMYNLYMKNDKTKESISYFKKINSVLGTMSLNKMLYAFLGDSFSNSKLPRTSYYFQINSSFLSPKFAEIYNDLKESISYIEIIESNYPNSISVKFFMSYYNELLGNNSVALDFVPQSRVEKYKASVHMAKGEYLEAVDIYEKLLEELNIMLGYSYETIAINLFDSYLKVEFFDKALEFSIKNFLSNKYLIMRFDINTLNNKIEHLNEQNNKIKSKLSLVILNFILYNIYDNKGQRKIYASYANFLKNNNVEKPTDLKSNKEKYDSQELIFFLKNICITMIMDSSYYFESSEEIDNERINICKWLCELDLDNKDIYMNEISIITKNYIVLQRIQEVEESKIYVDTDGIQKSIQQSFKESFERYKTFESFADNNIINLFDVFFLEESRFESIIIFEPNESIISYVKDYKYLAYKELFMDLRDLFISSNEYGLDSYLSTRIRHGTILSQLRSVFKTEKLVTEQDSITKLYLDNEYWCSKINLDDNKLNSILKKFSENIDNIILKVPSLWIQIKTEDKNTEGLLDFIFSDSDIYSIYIKYREINDYKNFMDKNFAELWSRTDENLSAIKNKLSLDLQHQLIEEINKLESNLKNIFNNNSTDERYDLLRAITKCRTDIQNEIKNISKWFNLPEAKNSKSFSIEELVDTCIKIIEKLYPHNTLNYSMDLNFDKQFKGYNFSYFVDIFLILLDNIIKHSSSKVLEKKVNILVLENSNIEIHVKNNLSEDIEEQNSLIEKIKLIKKKLKNNTDLININSEGGSGFFKIEKIINYDLRTVGNLDLYIENGYFCVNIKFKTEGILIDEYSNN